MASLTLVVACGSPPPIGSVEEAIIGGTGAGNITGANVQVNTYYLALSADAAAGSTKLTVGSTTGVAVGDLVMVAQMQGASILTANDATYGTVTPATMNGAGTFEFISVTAVDTVNKVITVDDSCGGLKHSYSAAGKTQVVFVPQYTTLAISGSITAPAWNGSTGGIIAINATGAVTFSGTGKIDASGLGFRGGKVDANGKTQVDAGGHNDYVTTTATGYLGAEKGEGIAGYESDFGTAYLGKGAPANGGGGGDNHNGGGGGGANAGDIAAWNGTGVMNGSLAVGEAAWTLDPDYIANGNKLTASTGGGRGGYTYSANVNDATMVGPGNTLWGGDDRYDHGGLGGRPLSPNANSALFFGGGGGAGDANNGVGGGGGAGGGLVYVIAGSIAGTGSILADGANGGNTTGAGNDAPGGAGAGGSIVVAASSIANAVSLSANGGIGGLQNIATTEAEGPGGGGGGGFIVAPTLPTLATVTGGAGGTTNSKGVVTFPDNGSTDGHAGTIAAAAVTAPLCQPSLAISITNSTPATPGGTITYTVVVVNDSATAGTLSTAVVGALPGTLSNVSWTCVGANGGTCAAGTGAFTTTASLPRGATATYTVTATIDPAATGNLTVGATATAGALTSSASDTVTLTGSANLGVGITATPEPDALGDLLTYTITVTNAGPSVAQAPSLAITLDANETFSSITGGSWVCTGTSSITCTLASLAVTSSVLTLKVTPAAVGTVTLGAAISSTTTDPTPGNNSTTHTTTIKRCLANSDCPSPATCTLATDVCTLAPPVITSPADLTVTADTTPTISGTCVAGVAVNISVDGGAVQAATVTGTTWSFTPATALSLATHTFVATATVGSGAAKVTSANSNTDHVTIVACVVNGDCTTSTAAFCTPLHVCTGCNGDNGSGATFACGSTTPYCAASGACGKCTNATNCVGHPAGPLCNTTTGACGTGCSIDSDCNDATKWCNAGTCTPKTLNGNPLPSVAPINSLCSVANATRVCLSGVCDPTNQECGLTNGKICGPPTTNAKCDSTACFATDNLCGKPNGQSCATPDICRSDVCFTDTLCGLPNGQTCNSNFVCRSFCVGADQKCGLLNGSPCALATDCRSGVCNADGHCGDPNGTVCAGAVTCRSAICTGGTCGPRCTLDADCQSGNYCDIPNGVCLPQLPNTQPCARAAMCTSAVCNADGKCGDPDGTACTGAVTCRSAVCKTLLCGGACTTDPQCGAGNYCNAGSCAPVLVNNQPCTRATMCLSAVCNVDGKCGNPTGQPCPTAAVCRSSVCDATNTCAATCGTDRDCDSDSYCDATSMNCVPAIPNGMTCARNTECVSGVCNSDGKCGVPDGQPCGSSLLCRSNSCPAATGVCTAVVVVIPDMAIPLDMTGASADMAGGSIDMSGAMSGAADMSTPANSDMSSGKGGADMASAKRVTFSGGGFCNLAPADAPSSNAMVLLILGAFMILLVRRHGRQ